jgi:hypothetical protein
MTFASRIASQKAQRGSGQGCLREVWQPNTVYVHDTDIYLLVSFVTPRGIKGNLSQASDSDGSLGSANQAHGSAEAQLPEQPTSPESREITMAEDDSMSLTDCPIIPHASDSLYPFDAEVPNHNAYALPLQDIRTQETFGLTERQAFLFMTYVQKLAPLVSMVCHITTISNKLVRRL